MPCYERYWLERGQEPTTEIVIEKGIPIPPTKKHRNHYRYPWKEMAVGNSFYAEVDVLTIKSNAAQTGKLLGRKFFVQQNGAGVRVWRTS